jgi:hypothetical protein
MIFNLVKMFQSEEFSYDDYESADDSEYRPSPEVEIDSEETPNDVHVEVNNKGKSKVVAKGNQKNKKKRQLGRMTAILPMVVMKLTLSKDR